MGRDITVKVNLSSEVKERVEWYASQLGLSQSGLLAFVIGQWIFQQDQVVRPMVQEISENVNTAVLTEIQRNMGLRASFGSGARSGL